MVELYKALSSAGRGEVVRTLTQLELTNNTTTATPTAAAAASSITTTTTTNSTNNDGNING